MLKLSDASQLADDFRENKDKHLSVDLLVDVYNINAGHNKALLEACTALWGYAEFVRRTRDNQKTMLFAQAVTKAVDDCIRDGILADFFRANKGEVLGMSIFEFNREEYERQVRWRSARKSKQNVERKGHTTPKSLQQGTFLRWDCFRLSRLHRELD